MQLETFSTIGNRFFILIMVIVMVSSCIPNRRLVYFPDRNFNVKEFTHIDNMPTPYKLQPRDVLSLNIKTLDKDAADYFNNSAAGQMVAFNEGIGFLNGHSIDENGTIKLPEIGRVKVSGLTVSEAQQFLEEALSPYLNKPTIHLKLVSFKVTVLGEVRNPGHYYIYNERSTVLECLGMAGDLTDFGNRENITIIRQRQDGVDATLINLRDPKVLASGQYYVQPNDVIYVQPMRAKTSRQNINTLSVLGVITGVISSGLLILNFLGVGR